MHRFKANWLLIPVVVLAVLALSGCMSVPAAPSVTKSTTLAQTTSSTSPYTTPTTTPATVPTTTAPASPPEVIQYAKDWPLPNRDYNNTRATMDSGIDSANVKALGAAWVHNVPSGASTFGSISCMPIIMGDTVYIQDLGNNIFALDLATGAVKWQTTYNLSNLGPSGPSVGYGKVFASAGPYDVVALDANDGKELWRTTLAQGVSGIDMQTTVYDGLVYVSTVPGNSGVFYAGGGIGTIYALDQETGQVVWSFETVDSKDLWGNPEINSGGGSWYVPAIDTETGISYWGIANPAPFPGQKQGPGISQDWPNGTSRPGPNLYTNSLTALDHKTGAMKWFTQVWPHDIADYDFQIPPILASANYGGKQQDIVIGAGKMGRVYAFNRDSGSILWETMVGEHNGNGQLSAFPTNGTITVLPGIIGGVETPLAYADGVVYVAANNLATDFINGLEFKLHPFSENTGNLVAIDVNTGHILWDVKLSSGAYGAATVVNDLVFTGTYDGMLYAFKRDTGEQVWSYKAPASVNAWPSVAGDTIVWPIAGPAGPISVIAFKLGATSPAVKIVAPTDGESLPAGDLPVSVEVTNFNVVNKLGQTNAPGEGHIHYYLDVDAPTALGQPAIGPAGSVWTATADTSYTFKNVAAGPHTISVQLVNNDHTPLSPPVVQKITVTLDTNPRIKISEPKNGAIKKTGPITINVEVSNFNVVDKQGQANVPGEGHVHFYMDVTPPDTPGQPAVPTTGVWAHVSGTSYTFENVAEGMHNVYVQLVNNDHTPLSPGVIDTVQVFVITYTGGLPVQ